MARRTVPMIEVDEILYRWSQGMSDRKIAKSLGISRNTVKKILSKAKAQQGYGLQVSDHIHHSIKIHGV